MTAMITDQLGLWDDGRIVVSDFESGIGRVLRTTGGGWRARWTGEGRWGWVFDRAIVWNGGARQDWETWEPDLPYGIDKVEDRDQAVAILEQLARTYGDDPYWLLAWARGRTLAS